MDCADSLPAACGACAGGASGVADELVVLLAPEVCFWLRAAAGLPDEG